MGNSYFHFKKFSIVQEKSAMKVCTDSCLFGALIPAMNTGKILDIGTGTGLLALMMAQKSSAEVQIQAIEIDAAASMEATKNIENSTFRDKIMVKNTSFQNYFTSTGDKFDLIVSNPPFFSNHLQSQSQKKNLALHNTSLSFQDLSFGINKLLNQDGKVWILSSAFQTEKLIEQFKLHNLFQKLRIKVRNSMGKPVIRDIIQFTRVENVLVEERELVIRTENDYTESFKELLKDYYLKI